jgi:hypothetical protein
MTDRDNTDIVPHEGRNPDGRFAPGNSLGIPFGPDNPPPKSPGRPRKGAWVKQLEQRLKSEPRIGIALADRLLKIALKGRDGEALRAIQEIEDRTGGPLKLRIDGMSEEELGTALTAVMSELGRRLPPEYHQEISDAFARVLLADDERHWVVIDQEPR